jgi:hypothetical protein
VPALINYDHTRAEGALNDAVLLGEDGIGRPAVEIRIAVVGFRLNYVYSLQLSLTIPAPPSIRLPIQAISAPPHRPAFNPVTR